MTGKRKEINHKSQHQIDKDILNISWQKGETKYDHKSELLYYESSEHLSLSYAYLWSNLIPP